MRPQVPMFSFFKPKQTLNAPPAAADATAPAVVPVADAAPAKASWTERLKAGLSKTRAQLTTLFTGIRVDQALFEELEFALIAASPRRNC